MTKLGDVILRGAHSGRPAAGTAGRLYFETDTLELFRDSGSAWESVEGATSSGMTNPMTTQDDLIVGGASGAPARLAKGSDGQVLTVDPSTHHLVWAAPASGFANPMTTAGDLIVGGSSGAPGRLGIGSASQVLTVVSGAPAWADASGGGGIGTTLNLWNPNLPPFSASALDDEFDDAALDGKWTEYDPGSVLTVTEAAHGLQLEYAAGSGYKLAGLYQSCPSGDWMVACRVALLGEAANYLAAGLMLGQDLAASPTTSDIVDVGIWRGSGNTYGPIVDTWSDYQTVATQHIAIASDLARTSLYLRIRRSGTTLSFDASDDGLGWTQRHSMTQPFTPAHVGVYIVANNSKTSRAVFSFFRKTTDPSLLSVLAGARI